MADGGSVERGKAVESPATLADACTDFIAANVGNLGGLGHPDRDLFMHTEVAEALVERISARGDMDDDAIAHFAAAHTRYLLPMMCARRELPRSTPCSSAQQSVGSITRALGFAHSRQRIVSVMLLI